MQKGVGIRLQQAGYTWVVVRSLDLFKIIVNRYMRVTIRTPNVIVLDDDDDDDEVEYIGWARSLDGWPMMGQEASGLSGEGEVEGEGGGGGGGGRGGGSGEGRHVQDERGAKRQRGEQEMAAG